MNKICDKYCDMINSKYGGLIKSIIIYGSNIYNGSNSDLDVCLIVDNCPEKIKNEIICSTKKFHEDNGLRIDEEIPFNNKLIYTYDEIRNTLDNPPFYNNGKVVINKIVKTKKFLSSEEMKKRLLLNIFTTDHLTIGTPTIEFEKKAFDIIVQVITKYYNLKNPTVNQLLDCMYVNQFDGSEGEMYLGYKKNYKAKEQYLINKLQEYIDD